MQYLNYTTIQNIQNCSLKDLCKDYAPNTSWSPLNTQARYKGSKIDRINVEQKRKWPCTDPQPPS